MYCAARNTADSYLAAEALHRVGWLQGKEGQHTRLKKEFEVRNELTSACNAALTADILATAERETEPQRKEEFRPRGVLPMRPSDFSSIQWSCALCPWPGCMAADAEDPYTSWTEESTCETQIRGTGLVCLNMTLPQSKH